MQLITARAEGYKAQRPALLHSNHHSTITPTTAPKTANTSTPAVFAGASPPLVELDITPPPPVAPELELPAATDILLAPTIALLGCAGAELAEYGIRSTVCPLTTTFPLVPSLIYSPPINCAGPPGTRLFPSTATAVPEISVTVKTAPAAVKTPISVAKVAGEVIVADVELADAVWSVTAVGLTRLVAFRCVKVLWSGGLSVSRRRRRRRRSCQFQLWVLASLSSCICAFASSIGCWVGGSRLGAGSP